MRKHLVWVVGLAAVFAAAGIALAAGRTTQEISGKATPSKLPSDKRVGVSLKISETTGTTDPSGVQPPTRDATVLLDRDFRLTTKGLAQCRLGQLPGKSTAEAIKACGDAKVGTGSAVARISNGSGGHTDIPAVVTAFNGKPGSGGLPSRGGRPIVILHIVIGANTVEVALSIERVAGTYGTKLATFPGGTSEPIRNLTLTLDRSFKAQGERQHYVSARCSHRELRYKGRFTYVGSPALTARDSQRCTVSQ